MILTLIVVFSLLFMLTHIGLSHGSIRQGLVDKLGQWPFRGLYSLVSFGTLGPAAVIWWQNRHLGPVLWELPFWPERIVAAALMLLALVVLLQGLATASPLTTQAEMTGRFGSGARGIQRVTRHPQNLAFMLFGLAHCLTNPYVGDWVFFGGFVVYGLVSAMHQDRRVQLLGPEEAKRLVAETSLVPFAAILAGRLRLAPREFSLLALLAALILFVALRHYHGALFGAYL